MHDKSAAFGVWERTSNYITVLAFNLYGIVCIVFAFHFLKMFNSYTRPKTNISLHLKKSAHIYIYKYIYILPAMKQYVHYGNTKSCPSVNS